MFEANSVSFSFLTPPPTSTPLTYNDEAFRSSLLKPKRGNGSLYRSSLITEHVDPSHLLMSPSSLLGTGPDCREVQTLCPTRRLCPGWKDGFVVYTRSQESIRMSMETLIEFKH